MDSSELLSQLQEGEFWVEEEEFLREFDEVTIGYPVTEAGHLQSLYSGKQHRPQDSFRGTGPPPDGLGLVRSGLRPRPHPTLLPGALTCGVLSP